MKLEQPQVEFAANKIGMIDSGESHIFIGTVNTENQIDVAIFQAEETTGVYYSCAIYGGVRIHISFEVDSDIFNEDIAALINSTFEKTSVTTYLIWIRNENRKLIEFIKSKYKIQPDCGVYYYASIEYIIRREMFDRMPVTSALDIRNYEEKYIDDYLTMLDGSMTFASPPPCFLINKERQQKHFAERADNKSFEAFWKDDELIGLYWRNNAEIDIMAVADKHQRKGYGSIILTRAIEMVFKYTTEDFAYLYAVDWNIKGQAFYKKYGMEQKGHSYLLRLNN